MNFTDPSSGGRSPGEPERAPGGPTARASEGRQGMLVLRLARRFGEIISECNEAQRQLSYRRLSYDRHLPEPDAAPETYAEFLLRTSGPLHREPSARARLAGRTVR